VGRGFTLAEVHEMTLAQVKAFLMAGGAAQRREHKDFLFLLRGAQYDPKNFKKLLKSLEDG